VRNCLTSAHSKPEANHSPLDYSGKCYSIEENTFFWVFFYIAPMKKQVLDSPHLIPNPP